MTIKLKNKIEKKKKRKSLILSHDVSEIFRGDKSMMLMKDLE